VPQDSPRIAELRRRVHADPASIAFAQLAEEYRRAGQFQEAVKYCRIGLARHPGYLSARVTLGRALMEIGGLDEAASEFELVLKSAADNLAAIRGMAEIQQRRGDMRAALDYYKRALTLARFDPELEETVNRISRELGAAPEAVSPPSSPRQPAARDNAPAPAGEPLIDFDALLASLGAPDAAPPPQTEMLLSDSGVLADLATPALPEIPDVTASEDPFADLERALRDFDNTPSAAMTAPDPTAVAMIEQLEAWLRVLHAERASPSA
jgi:tetratricopeptide (TPR) repeat protein